MTIELFITMLTFGSAFASLFTQATKKAFPNISSNVLAFINAIVVGIAGTLCAYVFLDIPFDAKNVISAFLMGLCIWMGSMVSYDKVIQTLNQLKR
jgi:hypothetical protein